MKNFLQLVSIMMLLLLASFNSEAQFKVIGYYPTWMNFPSGINSVDLAKVTHINIAFSNPNTSGVLIPGDGVSNADVTNVVNACHAKGVKVFMSIGGAGAPAATYKSLLSNSTNINNFVSKIVSYATTYNLDGIDVDIEGDVLDGTNVTAAQYQSFVTALATSLHAQSKQMSSALAQWFGNYVTNTAAAQFDWINMMSYDAYGPWSGPGQHSPYSLATSDFAYWNTTKAVPASKLVVGVPFYGYGWGSYASTDEIAYCDIVSTYPGAENNDQVGSGSSVIYYNGINTIKQKTTYAMQNAAGIMIWEIAEDCPTTSPKSLLLAIDQVVHAAVNPTITFNSISKNYGDAVFNVAATSNSTGAITYSITAGTQYATITSGGQVTIKGAGTVTIQASQAAATGYNAGTANATLTINKAPLTITAANKTKVYNTANPALTASYTGFVYSETNTVLTTQPSLSTTAVTNSNVGNYPITVSAATAANYTITFQNGTLAVTQATPTITYTGPTSGIQGNSITVSATTTSTGALAYTEANGTGQATLTGTTLNLTQSGTVTLTITVPATTNYTTATITQTITINPPATVNPTITFNNISKNYGDAVFTVAATSNSTGAITYSITAGTQYATITSGGQVTIKGAGTVTIQASQAAATGYNAGTANATLTINKAPLTITAVNKTKVYNTANPALTASYTGFVYSETNTVLTTQPSLSTTAVTNSNVGNYPITVSAATAANYTITFQNGTLAVTQATPTITYTGPTSGGQGSSITVSATTTSTGALGYTEANGSGQATLTGTTLNLTQPGTVNVTITVPATANYTTASIIQTITINATIDTPITFNNISKTYGDPAFTIQAYSNSPGAITYAIVSGSQFASLNGNQVTILGAGTVSIQANQAASGSYNAGTATATLTINKSNGGNLTFTSISSGNVGDVLTLNATTSSTGSISYALVNGGTGSASISGNQLTLNSAGIVTIQINVAGDNNYNAQTITQDITINSITSIFAPQSVDARLNVYPNPVLDYCTVNLSLKDITSGTLELCDLNGRVLKVINSGTFELESNYTIPLNDLSPGMYLVKLTSSDKSLAVKITK